MIFVADEIDSSENMKYLPSNVVIARTMLNINKSKWNNFSLKYNLIEFYTAVKPYSFLYLFENTHYDKEVSYYRPNKLGRVA